MIVPGELHPGHGPHDPTSGTPQRVPGSVRRTSTMDMVRPDGLTGDLHLVGRSRDLVTGERGEPDVLVERSCRAVVDFMAERNLTELQTTPPHPRLQDLLGASVSSGFRRLLDAAVPGLDLADGLLFLLLDELPVATLVSGQAIGAGLDTPGRLRAMAGRPPMAADLCAGFVSGGVFMSEFEREGISPPATGPPAPSLAVADDPLAWHHTGPLPDTAMRRARRMDLIPGDDTVHLDGHFRDTYVRADGVETVIHEYTFEGEIDPERDVLLRCEAHPRVLPWIECPVAAASASRLGGMSLHGLRRHIKESFVGTSTCTHLNDTLRALEGLAGLARYL